MDVPQKLLRNTVDSRVSILRLSPILGFFTKFRIREFAFFFSSDIIKIIFATFLNPYPPQISLSLPQ